MKSKNIAVTALTVAVLFILTAIILLIFNLIRGAGNSNHIVPLVSSSSQDSVLENTTAQTTVTTATTVTTVTTTVVTTTTNCDDLYTKQRGTIYDNGGNVLAQTIDGQRIISDNYSFMQGTINEIDADKSKGGKFTDLLRKSSYTDQQSTIGNNILLTLDAEKTRNIYNTLKGSSFEGAVVVQKPDGQIISMASTDESSNNCTGNYFIGSTAKMMISTSMLENNVPLDYADSGTITVEGFTFYNWDCDSEYSSPVNRSLTDAFAFSANTYFINAAISLGKDNVFATVNKYFSYNKQTEDGIGYVFPTDWGYMYQPDFNSTIENETKLAQFAIGLTCKLSPVYLASITNTIATGQMVQPYMLAGVTDPVNGETVAPGTASATVGEPVSANTKSALYAAMRQTALDDNLDGVSDNSGNYYTYYIKTGTADVTGTGEGENMWVTGFVTDGNQNPVLTVTMLVTNGHDLGYKFASALTGMYNQVMTEALS
ncbi:MAG: hypothetical protein LKG21_01695 [Ruminococcus sp.]|jgi:cell division protein FtsI/penicillin-binding protein 2|nr:hypothetical protein [Ruminococcus sp.]